MKKEQSARLYRSGLLTEIDIHFARFITGLSGSNDQDIFLAAALVSNAVGNGNVCFDLALAAGKALPEEGDWQDPVVCPELAAWQKKLCAARVIGSPGDYCPLILDEKNRLYLYRYWNYERRLSDSIKKRVKEGIDSIDLILLKDSLKRLFPGNTGDDTDWQRVAALISTFKRFCVISGGPGTGKTTTVASILALLLEQADGKGLRIFLAAPTGKAAAKLKESIRNVREGLNCRDRIKDLIPSESYTIHRMLKTIPGSPYFRYNSENLLPADVVVVDEASMVDIALMSKLVEAVPVDARLILIGDMDQLASVEAGSVLGDICDRESIHRFSGDFCKNIEELTGERLGPSIKECKENESLNDCIVALQKSYRFTDDSGIGELSCAVKMGNVDRTLQILKDVDPFKSTCYAHLVAHKKKDLFEALEKKIVEGYSEYLKTDDPCEALKLFNQFKILCAVRSGPFGVYAVNRLAEQLLGNKGLIRPDGQWYRGRPVLITVNDYNLELFNGDIGIIMAAVDSGSNDLYAFFHGISSRLRRFPPYRLPEHETVYAMTVHKSQGSEFENVCLLLPDKDYPVLTRELIYTGITRAKQSVTVWGTEAVIAASISRRIERTSGLYDALWR